MSLSNSSSHSVGSSRTAGRNTGGMPLLNLPFLPASPEVRYCVIRKKQASFGGRLDIASVWVGPTAVSIGQRPCSALAAGRAVIASLTDGTFALTFSTHAEHDQPNLGRGRPGSSSGLKSCVRRSTGGSHDQGVFVSRSGDSTSAAKPSPALCDSTLSRSRVI